MGMPFPNPVVGGETLIRPAVQSPDYVAGTSGWAIKQDGSAQFSTLVLIGTPIDGSAIATGSIGTTEIADGAVTNALLAAAAVAAANIQNATITGTKIASGTITAALLAAGIVVAGIVDGTTVTGATVETATSGARVVLDNTGTITVYNSSGTAVATLSASAQSLTAGPSGAIQIALTAASGDGIMQVTLPGTWNSEPEVKGFTKTGTSGTYGGLEVNGAANPAAGHTDWVSLGLNSSDSASSANMAFNYVDANGSSHGQAVLDYAGFRVLAGTTKAVKPGTGTSPTNAAYPEVWHTITLDSGWSTLAGHPAPAYRLLPDGNVQFTGLVTHASFTGNVALNSSNPLPSQYWPANEQYITGDTNRAGWELNVSGVVYAVPQSGGSSQVEINGIIQLDH